MGLSEVGLLHGAGNRNSFFLSASHDKRNLWWRAFRKTVLEPHRIFVFDTPVTERLPPELLSLVEEMCQKLDRHEAQALDFRDAVQAGRGFGPSPIFPPDIVAPMDGSNNLSRCLEAEIHPDAVPSYVADTQAPPFEIPTPRPSLACGFSATAFTESQLRSLPRYLQASGTISNYETGDIIPGQAIYCPFLIFERTYGHAKHEIESAMNYCAMAGTAALNAIDRLQDLAWRSESSKRPSSHSVFSCVIDDDIALINHHWIGEDREFLVAPLCKFDLRDMEHFMHFLAWTEAIEQWAVCFLIPDIKEALDELEPMKVVNCETPRALPTPVTLEEKHSKLERSMKLAFENIPWKGERSRNTPLGVTSAMRMRSPRVAVTDESGSVSDATSSTDPCHSLTGNEDTRKSSVHSSETDRQARTVGLPLSPPLPPPPPAAAPEALARATSPSIVKTVERLRFPGQERLETGQNEDDIVTENKSVAGLSDNRPTSESEPGLPVLPSLPTSARSFGSDMAFTAVGPLSSRSNCAPSEASALKSPDSTMSVRSRKSFSTLKRDRRIRSPATPDFNGTSPKSASFRTKITNGFSIIKPKRAKTENAGPPTPRCGDAPMPTPAYDKLRFNVLKGPHTPGEGMTDQDFAEHIMNERIIVEASPKAMPLRTVSVAKSSNYLPLRQWATSPRHITATTLTTGP